MRKSLYGKSQQQLCFLRNRMRQQLTPSGKEWPYNGSSPGTGRLGLPTPRPPLCLQHAMAMAMLMPHGHLPTAGTGLAGYPAPWGQAWSLVSPSLHVMDNGGLGKPQQKNKHRVMPLLHPKQASDNHQLWYSSLNGPDLWRFFLEAIHSLALCYSI